MTKRKAPLDDEMREFFRRMGRKGGKIGGAKGGRSSLRTMTVPLGS